MQNNKTRVPYTDRGEVKAFIELQHAKHGRNHTPLWEMGCDLPSVNAAYLYEMLTIFPDAAIYANVDSPYSPLYFVSTMGDGILLPVRTPIRRRELPPRRSSARPLRRTLHALKYRLTSSL